MVITMLNYFNMRVIQFRFFRIQTYIQFFKTRLPINEKKSMHKNQMVFVIIWFVCSWEKCKINYIWHVHIFVWHEKLFCNKLLLGDKEKFHLKSLLFKWFTNYIFLHYKSINIIPYSAIHLHILIRHER